MTNLSFDAGKKVWQIVDWQVAMKVCLPGVRFIFGQICWSAEGSSKDQDIQSFLF